MNTSSSNWKTLLSKSLEILRITTNRILNVNQSGLFSLYKFQWIEDTVCTGGQPSLHHLELLHEQGIRTLINLRRPSEHDSLAFKEKAEELKIEYFNIPVAPKNPLDSQVDRFLTLTDNAANKPLFIHCTAAVRVGAFWMIRRVLRDGWTIERAEREAERVGLPLGSSLNRFARKYISRYSEN